MRNKAHYPDVPRVCDICGEHETHERRTTGWDLDVVECEDGLMRCDVCLDDYDGEVEP